MKSFRFISIIALILSFLIGLPVASNAAGEKINTRWSGGHYLFFDRDSGSTIMEIKDAAVPISMPFGWNAPRFQISNTTVTATANQLNGLKTIVTITTNTTINITTHPPGTVFLLAAAQGDTTITLTLPTAATGIPYSFVDADVSAGADLAVQANTDDTINGGTAAKKYVHGNGSTGIGVIHLMARDAVDWMLMGPPMENGAIDSGNTWRNNNS